LFVRPFYLSHWLVFLLIKFVFTLGEAKYIEDIPLRVDELYGAFVLSTRANCLLDKLDASISLVI
jgi:xanthine dehydrogenase molybdopterin-binding subunit B